MANEFRKSFDEMARQAELDELRKEIDDLKKNNPISEIANSVADVGAQMSQTPAVTEGAGPTPPQTTAPPEGPIEPRSGEFAVTDTAAAKPSSEPVAP
jgi:sec-independent protein translocase protein TatB